MRDTTIEAYDRHAGEYADMAETLHELAEMEAMVGLLDAGARLLDLGCGPGNYGAWFAARGLKVDALDASGEMVALAAAHPGVNARQGRFEDLPARPTYHAIWANFSLLHLPRAALPAQLRRLKGALIPSGLLHLGMKLGSGEKTDDLGRFYAYWREDELEELLLEAGFTITARRLGQGKGLAGKVEPHILIRAHG